MSGDEQFSEGELTIVDRYINGESDVRLAVDFGLPKSHLNRILKRHGVPRRPQPTLRNLSAETREQIVQAYHAGLSGAETSYLVGVSRALVYTLWQLEKSPKPSRRRNGAPGRSWRVAHARRDLVLANLGLWMETQYHLGRSMEQIAADLRVHRDTVARGLKSRGVQLRQAARPRKFTSEQQAEIAAKYVAGAGLDVLAREYGAAQSTIGKVLTYQGVPARTRAKSVRKLTPEQEADLAARYTAGEPAEALEAEYKVTTATIFSTIRRTGHSVRSPGRPRREVTPEQAADITRRYQSGESMTTIARDYGIARPRVTEIAVQGGAAPRKKRRAKGTVQRRGGRKP